MTNEDLNVILENHKHWINKDCKGWSNMRAKLRMADLRWADLSDADLRGADLRDADLRRANLRDADLRGADLIGADIRWADLRDADLRGAKLSGAKISGICCNELTTGIFMQCPEEGSFIAFKKVQGYIIKLEVPAEARRSSETTRKCRCEFAKVLSITHPDGSDAGVDQVENLKYNRTLYQVGEVVHADSWDEDRWNECSHGIHFFITREEAVNY